MQSENAQLAYRSGVDLNYQNHKESLNSENLKPGVHRTGIQKYRFSLSLIAIFLPKLANVVPVLPRSLIGRYRGLKVAYFVTY